MDRKGKPPPDGSVTEQPKLHVTPNERDEYNLQPGQTVLDVLVSSGLASSKGEGRRLIQQNGVRLDGVTMTDPNLIFPQTGVLQVGKRHFIRVK